ncbi:hypothetical protein [Mycobacterium sp. 1245801.1]|uniref:hypothetical protein n=1 Tax=Mycobacterium sp. 1245801.1 TaxID=1834075 RepID=UPI0007FFC7D8|nr:hypothetical protein [Mycobacterium sp. 1245801.1]OBJ19882.1 hypothetical protein A5622_20180 [Mycobacterium sp. 1245801.1]
MSDHERRCGAGELCHGHTVVDGKRVPAQLSTATGLCQPCQRWVRSSMRALPSDWCKLKLTIGESRAPVGGGGRRPKPGSRVPINTAADDLMRQIAGACDTAAVLVSDAVHTQWHFFGRPTGRDRDYRMIEKAVRLVAERVDTLVACGAIGIHAALRLAVLHRYATRHLGETRQREKQHLPCPSCGAQALVKEVRDLRGRGSVNGVETPEVIRCLACDGGPNGDGTWTEAEYQWLSKMVLTEREEQDVLKWLLAEAQWERDVAAWLAAEREFALDLVASMLDIDGMADLMARVQGMAA